MLSDANHHIITAGHVGLLALPEQWSGHMPPATALHATTGKQSHEHDKCSCLCVSYLGTIIGKGSFVQRQVWEVDALDLSVLNPINLPQHTEGITSKLDISVACMPRSSFEHC